MFYNEKFDIFIEAGQSNADGTGMGPTTEIYEPTSDILYMKDTRDYMSFGQGVVTIKPIDSENSIEIANDHTYNGNVYGDFALTFAKDYVNNGFLQPDRKVLIVRTASGGTGFESGHWKIGDYLYNRMLALVDFAISLNPENKIVGFLWHQGENDVGHDSLIYNQRLTAMLKSVRSRYGENIPFIAGDFANEWKSEHLAECEPIVAQIRNVVTNNQPASFVETADLLSNNQQIQNGDPIHFSRNSLYILGHRYFDAFKKIYSNKVIQ